MKGTLVCQNSVQSVLSLAAPSTPARAMHSTNCHSRSTLATHSPIRFVISLPASTTVPCPPGARQHDDESSDGGVISDDGVREAAARRGIGAHAQEGADRHRALHRLR
ncbi:unnamed protein product, partial [Closterium sp. NIES-65]